MAEIQEEMLKGVTRRTFFGHLGLGLGSVALASMLQRESRSADINEASARTAVKSGPAKHVIYLHMAGSPSQLDLFDDKPALRKFNGQPCPDELLKGKRFAFISGVPNMLGSPFSFQRHGRSGAELSSVWKHLPKVMTISRSSNRSRPTSSIMPRRSYIFKREARSLARLQSVPGPLMDSVLKTTTFPALSS